MKKKIIGMLSLMLCLLFSVSLVACNKNKHEAKSEWKYNDTQHWHECATNGHDDKLDEAEHPIWAELLSLMILLTRLFTLFGT